MCSFTEFPRTFFLPEFSTVFMAMLDSWIGTNVAGKKKLGSRPLLFVLLCLIPYPDQISDGT